MLPIQEKLLTGYNRPFRKLKKLKGIVVHWTANIDKGANALANYSYFNRPKPNQNVVYGSAHYIVDDSTILRVVPDDEEAYHVGATTYKPLVYGKLGVPSGDSPNYYTIGIEMCVNSDGNFVKTRQNTIDLIQHLCNVHNLSRNDLYRHFDITGKDCPKMMLDNVIWNHFLDEIFQSTANNQKKYIVTASQLNIRKGFGTNYDIIGTLNKNQIVTVTASANGWYEIGDNMWINSSYVTEVLP